MRQTDKLTNAIKQYIVGDNSAFDIIYEESYKYLYTCAIHIVKDEDIVQDMLQNTYIEIVKSISQLKEPEYFLGWATTIANRKCLAYLKKQKDVLLSENTNDEGDEVDFFESVADDEAIIPENIFDERSKVDIIKGIIDELSDVQRACVIGFYYNEQKQDEIAEELGIPVNTVKSHLNRAKIKIKEAVGDIEKKQGIKLYSFAPFLLHFFMKEVDSFGVAHTVPKMGEKLTTAISAGTIAATGAAKSKVAATGVKGVMSAAKTKLTIGLVTSTVAVAGVTGAYIVHNQNQPEEVLVEVEEPIEEFVEEIVDEKVVEPEKPENYLDFSMNIVDMEKRVVINGRPLSEITFEEFVAESADTLSTGFYDENTGGTLYPGTLYEKEINQMEGAQVTLDSGKLLEFTEYEGMQTFEIRYDESLNYGYSYQVSDFMDNGKKSPKQFMDELDPKIYDLLFKYEYVYFNGGKIYHRSNVYNSMTKEGENTSIKEDTFQFWFDETDDIHSWQYMSIEEYDDGKMRVEWH